MTAVKPRTAEWLAGYAAGHARGAQDATAEHADTYSRDPSHIGHVGEPPDLPDPEHAQWIDGFLAGYGHARGDSMGGVHV